ncbi:PilT/PilU family type 4a pilus ATPase [bacterium]|nr:PilT/PilU family type 4a pilus ATPase [bacterium]
MAKLDALLRLLEDHGGSDLHMVPNEVPVIRINGSLRRTSLEPLTSQINKKYFYEIMDTEQIRLFEQENDVDFSYEIKGVARFRGNIFRQNNGISGVFRLIPTRVLSVNELGISSTIQDFIMLKNGLVLVTGPTGSGKSTTLASLIDLINSTKDVHIITIEDPLEFVHEEKKALITHREVGRHSKSFANALRSAMREDPDVIMVGEMRDLETIALALTAAEMGVLVFGTLHTNSAPKTINRIIDVFPDNQQEQIRTMLASSLKGVVAQQLLEKKDGSGRIAVHEVLVVNPGVSNLIREGKSHQISSIMETNKKEGNCTMDQTLQQLYKSGKISGAQALRKSMNKKLFENIVTEEELTAENMGQSSLADAVIKVDVSQIERSENLIGQFVESMLDCENDAASQSKTVILKSAGQQAAQIGKNEVSEKTEPEALFVSVDDFQDKIQAELEKSVNTGTELSLIIIEIDGLADVLQAFSFSQEDVLQVLKSCLRDNDYVTNTDEQVYLILCPCTGVAVDAISQRIFKNLKSFFSENNLDSQINVNVGDATYPTIVSDSSELLQTASEVKYFN